MVAEAAYLVSGSVVVAAAPPLSLRRAPAPRAGFSAGCWLAVALRSAFCPCPPLSGRVPRLVAGRGLFCSAASVVVAVPVCFGGRARRPPVPRGVLARLSGVCRGGEPGAARREGGFLVLWWSAVRAVLFRRRRPFFAGLLRFSCCPCPGRAAPGTCAGFARTPAQYEVAHGSAFVLACLVGAFSPDPFPVSPVPAGDGERRVACGCPLRRGRGLPVCGCLLPARRKTGRAGSGRVVARRSSPVLPLLPRRIFCLTFEHMFDIMLVGGLLRQP